MLTGRLIRLAMAELADGGTREPPTEVLLLPYGRIETRKGTFCLSPEGANQIIMKWKEHGVDLMLDYEHGAVETNGQPAPAAGWAQLDLRNDGIWMTHIKWTAKAAEYLRNGEYRYLSPAFTADKDSHEILELINVAMTNLPASDNIAPLVAASLTAGDVEAADDDTAEWFLSATFMATLKAVPYKAAPIVDGAWDATAATKRLAVWASSDGSGDKDKVDWSRYQEGFAIVRGAGTAFGDFALPHHDVREGHLVTSRSGVMAAGGVLQGSRGGVKNASDADVAAAKAHLAQHYHQWGGKAPWEKDEETNMTFRERLAQFTAANKDVTVAKLCQGLGIDKAQLKQFALGAMPSQEEMGKMAACAKGKLDIFEGDSEEAPIDASINGGDVNKPPLPSDDDSAASVFDSASTSSDESDEAKRMKKMAGKGLFGTSQGDTGGEMPSPTHGSPDEAAETQGDKDISGAIGMRMKDDRRAKELLSITGAKTDAEAQGVLLAWRETAGRYEADHAELVRLKNERDAGERRELVAAGKAEGKLTPSLIKLFEGKSNAEFRAFLSVAPTAMANGAAQLREGHVGGDNAFDLTPDEAFVEQLIPGDPKETVAMRKTLSVTLKEGTIIARTGDSAEYNLSITKAFTNPVEPNGWLPRTSLRRNQA